MNVRAAHLAPTAQFLGLGRLANKEKSTLTKIGKGGRFLSPSKIIRRIYRQTNGDRQPGYSSSGAKATVAWPVK
jgi:hypothetical protein